MAVPLVLLHWSSKQHVGINQSFSVCSISLGRLGQSGGRKVFVGVEVEFDVEVEVEVGERVIGYSR